jgi:glucosamine-6-phosphate deaminase
MSAPSGLLRLRIFRDRETAARILAADIARAVAVDPGIVLGLPTGRTPLLLYRHLGALCARGAIDFSRATTFNLDEFAGVGGRDRRSHRAFMQRHFFDHVNLTPRRIHFLDGRAADPAAECARYERAIARAGGIDLLLLGLGTNGHVGFNEPAASLIATTHVANLTDRTRRANASLFGWASTAPGKALTMGMGTILQGRRIVLLATGLSKQSAVRRMVTGPITPRVPASLLQLHGRVEVWLDEAAAAQLPSVGRRPVRGVSRRRRGAVP